MEEINPQTGVEPVAVPVPPAAPQRQEQVIGEFTVDELNERIGRPHPETGIPLTRLEELALTEAEQQGGRLITKIGHGLSEAALAANRALHDPRAKRYGAGAAVMSVIAIRYIHNRHENKSE